MLDQLGHNKDIIRVIFTFYELLMEIYEIFLGSCFSITTNNWQPFVLG